MYVTTLPEAAHLRNRPRKSLKNDFLPENHMRHWQFWYHSHGCLNLYKLSYTDLRSIHWGEKFRDSENSA